MSHTIDLSKVNTNFMLAEVIIVNYVVGGETVAASEFNLSAAITGVIFATIPGSKNSLGVPLFPSLDAGKVKLFQFVGGSPTEIAATVGLNAQVIALLKL